MPDRRRHRGANPRDAECFAQPQLPKLRRAVDELSWLLGRGYPPKASLSLVGNRHCLRDRQRKALQRVAAADHRREARQRREVPPDDVRGRHLLVDGYNVLLTVEAALAGALVLVGRDGTARDLASLHGHFKRVEQTRPALACIGETLEDMGPRAVSWYFDRAISNSGRLRGTVLEEATRHAWPWTVELVTNPDPILERSDDLVATADSGILDAGPAWVNLARRVVERHAPEAWILTL